MTAAWATASRYDLTTVSQRWLRDMLWDHLADKLTQKPPRTQNRMDAPRRACAELSAFLEIHAPGGGHDSSVLTGEHMVAFVADQRHRAENRLPSLARSTDTCRRRAPLQCTPSTCSLAPAEAVQVPHRTHCSDCRHPCSPRTGACWTDEEHQLARAAREAAEERDEAAYRAEHASDE